MDNKRVIIAHLCMLGASAGWGLMAPLGKQAMSAGIGGTDLVSFRVAGGMVLFWLTSLLWRGSHEKVSRRDLLMFLFASLFGLVFNQCCYTIGLSITSPINASIVVTSMPIFTMILAAIILREPITSKKVMGIFFGCIGAIILILTSASAMNAKVGDIRGDLLCLFAQFSFALYLNLFGKLIRRYNVITVNKWMFTYATLLILPFTFRSVASLPFTAIGTVAWLEVAYVVVVGTYLGYILTMTGQKTLRPTVVSIYNYVQPIVSVSVSVLMGIGIFKWGQAVAVLLVCFGVWLVTKSKSRRDMLQETTRKQ